MTGTLPQAYRADAPLRQVRIRTATLRAPVLLQVSVCALPAAALVAAGSPAAAGKWLFYALLTLMAYSLIAGKLAQAAALLIALIPATMLLRGMFFYSAQIVLPMVPIVYQLAAAPDQLTSVRKNRLLSGLLLVAVAYWWVSFLSLGDYSSNFRLLELCFTAANVYLLANHRSYLATALVGLAISAFAMAAGLLPYGDRLGTLEVDDTRMGNPIATGLSATVVFLMIFADQGKWLLLGKSRFLLLTPAALALVLSTSRGSWLVTILGLILILILNRKGRFSFLCSLGVVAISIAILLQTDRGPAIIHYFDTATDSENSLAKRTTGRADQWESFPAIFQASPIWGFGPGSGKAVSLRYTKEGKTWHALYLLVGVETGSIGLIGLVLLFGALMGRACAHWRKHREIVPLLGLVSFLTIGVSVSGIDAISGVFLGLAFLAEQYPTRVRIRCFQSLSEPHRRHTIQQAGS
jgi:hypothetical protein